MPRITGEPPTPRLLGRVLDAHTHWFDRSYFELRLSEETYRSNRYGIPCSLVLASLPGHTAQKRSKEVAQAIRELGQDLRYLDVAGFLEPNLLAICLPHTDCEGAASVSQRVRAGLERFSVQVGTATCPDDGRQVSALLKTAMKRVRGPVRVELPIAG